MAPRDPREMTDEELQNLVGGAAQDPRNMSDDELAAAVGQPRTEWTAGNVKRALGDIADVHVTGAKTVASGVAEGIIHVMGLPTDMINQFTEVLTNKRYLSGSPEAIKSLKSLGLDYDPEPSDFANSITKKTAELGGGAGATGLLLRGTAMVLQSGKYVPQLVSQAQTVFQRLMAEASANPGLVSQEVKAGAHAGFAHGLLKQLWPDAPYWATLIAELGGGTTANPRKPSPLTVEGQEERVANTIADLNAGGRQSPGVDNKAGLQASLAEGRSRLTNPDGTPIVENFDPTSAQTAVTPTALPDGSTTVTRNLGPYEKATLGGSPELTAKLEGQARAINTATDQTFQNSNATPHPVEPSDAGQTIRQDLLAARQRQQAETENAYRNVNEKASTGMNQLVDDLLHVRASRNEADRAEDMPAEVEALLKTFEPNWPQDVLYKGQPLSYQDFLALRTKALQTKDPQLLSDTDNLMGTYLAPEKQMGLLKDWRTRVMGELEKTGVGGKLKLRLGQVRSSIENAIDSFGVGPGSEAENFRTASAEARKLKETFDSGQVGSVLEKEWGRHVLPESDVPGKFTSANRQPESWDSLVAAAGDPSEATAAARRIIQQRFQAQTRNAPQTPEGARPPSSEKFNNFLKNPDNKELIVNAFGQEHYDRLRQLEEMARVRETILKSPATAGSNSAEKLKALEQLKSGKELDKLFSSLTLRLGFVARAGRKATEMVYGDANEVMDRLFKDAMVDPELLSGLLSRTRTREAFRARQKYRLYLTQQPSQVEKKLEDSKDERVDLSDLLASDMDARSTSAKYSAIDDLEASGWPNPRGYSTGGKIAKALGAKWFSPLEKAIEEAPEHLNHTLDNWIKYLRGRTTQHGNAPVKDEEIEAVWPTASKLAINPGPDEIYDPKSKFKKQQILDAVREANKHVELPEFQTYDPAKLEDLKYTEEGSPLAAYSRIMRSTPDSPVQFEMHQLADHADRFSVIPGQGFGEPEIVRTGGDGSRSPLRFLLDQYNQDAGPKYGEHSMVRLPGGRDYKETVVGSTLSQPMSIDNAHFGSVPRVGQNQVSWSLHHNRFQEGLEPNLPEGGLPAEPQAPMTFTDNDLIERIRNEAPFMPEDRRLNEDPADLWGRISEAQRQQARDQHAQDTGRVWQNPEQAAPEGEPNPAPLTDIRHLADQVENTPQAAAATPEDLERANLIIHEATDGGEDVNSYLQYLRRQRDPIAQLMIDNELNGLHGNDPQDVAFLHRFMIDRLRENPAPTPEQRMAQLVTQRVPFSNERIARALQAHAETPVNQRPTFGPAQTADEIGLHNPFTDANEEETFPSFEAARAHWTDNYNGMTDEDFQQTARQFLDHYAPMEQPAGQTPNQQARPTLNLTHPRVMDLEDRLVEAFNELPVEQRGDFENHHQLLDHLRTEGVTGGDLGRMDHIDVNDLASDYVDALRDTQNQPNLPAAQATAPARDGNLYPTGWVYPENYDRRNVMPEDFEPLNPRLYRAANAHDRALGNDEAEALFVTRDGMAVTNPYDGEGFDDSLRDPVAYWTERGVPADQVRNAMRQFLDRYAPVEPGANRAQLPAPGAQAAQQATGMFDDPNRFYWDAGDEVWRDRLNPGRRVTHGRGNNIPQEIHPANSESLDPEFVNPGGYTFDRAANVWLDSEGDVVTYGNGNAIQNRFTNPFTHDWGTEPHNQLDEPWRTEVQNREIFNPPRARATQGNFPNHQPLGQGEWEVFDPADGRPVHLFTDEVEAAAYANQHGMDYAQRGQGWAQGHRPWTEGDTARVQTLIHEGDNILPDDIAHATPTDLEDLINEAFPLARGDRGRGNVMDLINVVRQNPASTIWENIHSPQLSQLVRAYSERYHTQAPARAPQPAPIAQQSKKALPPPPPPKPTGAKVTFIDELQSYRHQKGANEGYRWSDQDRKAFEKQISDVRADVERKFNIAVNKPPGSFVSTTSLVDGTAKQLMGDDPDLTKFLQMKEQYSELSKGTVPEGPYKKTWPLLQLRRMLWQAAQDGSDWLAWNTAKEVQKHGTQPGIADHIYDKTLPSIAKKEARRLGLPEDSVKRISIGKSNDSLTKGWDDKLKEHFITSSDPETGPEIMESLEYLDDNAPKMGDVLRKVLSKKEYEGLVAYQNEFRKARKKYRVLENLPAKDWTDEHDRIMDDYYVEGGKLSSLIEELDLVNRLGLRSGGNSWGLRLTPEARKKILEEGLPKFMIPATVGAGALAKKDEKPVN